MFETYEIINKEEQQLLLRLYKRLSIRTLKQKYGYIKSGQLDSSGLVSSTVLCQELELNYAILKLFDITTANQQVNITFLSFVQIMALFYLRKDCLKLRLSIFIRFL